MQYSHHITAGRATLAAAVTGAGSPVVFLHAAVCDSRMWQQQWRAVAEDHTAIAYDRRGFGATHAERQDHSAVADLLTVLDIVAGGEPAILVACSQGGRVALDAALLHPDRVCGLFLISPSVAAAPEPSYTPDIAAMLAQQRQAEAAGDLDQLNAVKARLWLDGPLQPENRVTGEKRALFLEMNGAALRLPPCGANIDNVSAYQRIGEITSPTLIVCGSFDFPHIQERCRHIAGMMPNAAFQPLPGTAHLPSLEQPAIITGLLLSFLQNPGETIQPGRMP
ncbi:alpha/beta hydrolase [Ferrovibrio sp.]|uniref:alpha/beta fold hydrolase n=1 Tax=Ferrovibrio sp. TaxID=1917215 RepID=UPI0025C39CC5|nr:alpha/beta hydrolase [Ferrovibrio sp.]